MYESIHFKLFWQRLSVKHRRVDSAIKAFLKTIFSNWRVKLGYVLRDVMIGDNLMVDESKRIKYLNDGLGFIKM